MKILDWYNHQGHQYEFFKLDAQFFLDRSGDFPNWNGEHRPHRENVEYCKLNMILDQKFDFVIYRGGSDEQLVKIMKDRGSKIIYVSQTAFKPEIKVEPDAVVWNCHDSMVKYSKYFNCVHKPIVHGYDPEEFIYLKRKRNGRILTLTNSFDKRPEVSGFDLWKITDDMFNEKIMDVYGSNNSVGLGQIKSFSSQIEIYNSYSAYFNPTSLSPMPRARAEAMMCGMPIITTRRCSIDRYLRDDECVYIESEREAFDAINKILNSESYAEELSVKSRNCAIREFGILKFLESWKSLLGEI